MTDEKKQEILKVVRRILSRIDKADFSGRVNLELNCINGGVRKYYSNWRVEEPSKLLTN